MREHTEQPESIYILQLQHGDKKSFETLFDQYYIPLVDYAYRLLHDRDAAKDHKESLAMNAKCEADVFVSMSALKVKRTERQEFYAFFK